MGYPCHCCHPCCCRRPCCCPPPCCPPPHRSHHHEADALDVLDVHAKTPGLYQVPKLRNLNLIFLDILDGRRDDGRTDRRPSDLYYPLVADKNTKKCKKCKNIKIVKSTKSTKVQK